MNGRAIQAAKIGFRRGCCSGKRWGFWGEEGNLGQDGVTKKGGFEGRQGPRRWIWEQCGSRDQRLDDCLGGEGCGMVNLFLIKDWIVVGRRVWGRGRVVGGDL